MQARVRTSNESDVSGVVEEVGPGVENFAEGAEVYYTPEIFGPGFKGGYIEYHVAAADIVAHKPASLSHEEATAIPLAGGVGSFVVQIAHAAGARVLASAGTDNQETLRELGADVAINCTRQDIAEVALEDTGGYGVDAVFDTVAATR